MYRKLGEMSSLSRSTEWTSSFESPSADGLLCGVVSFLTFPPTAVAAVSSSGIPEEFEVSLEATHHGPVRLFPSRMMTHTLQL